MQRRWPAKKRRRSLSSVRIVSMLSVVMHPSSRLLAVSFLVSQAALVFSMG